MKRFCAWCRKSILEPNLVNHVFWRERAFCGPMCVGAFDNQIWYQRHLRLRPIPYPMARPTPTWTAQRNREQRSAPRRMAT